MQVPMLEICHLKTKIPKNLVGWLELVTRLKIGLATRLIYIPITYQLKCDLENFVKKPPSWYVILAQM